MASPPVTPAAVTVTTAQPAASAGGFLATNTAEGGTSGTAVTAANTGGTSGTAFTAVNIGSGATFAPSNTRAAHGTLSYQVATVASANSYVTWTAAGGMPPQSWFRAYLYITANPASAFRLVTFLNGATRCAYVQLGTTGALQFIDHASTTMCQTTAAVPLNAWFRVEGYLVGSAASGLAELQLFTTMDGATPAETDTSAAGQATVGAPNGFSFGPFGAASIGPYWLDDLGISTSGYMGAPGSAVITPAALAVTTTIGVPVVRQDQTAAPSVLSVTSSVPVPARWVLVQATAATPTATGTISKAFTSPVTTTNRIIVYTGTCFGVDVTAPTDSQGNTYTKLAGAETSSSQVFADIWTTVASATGALTITVTNTGTQSMGFTAEEYSGVSTAAGTGCLDVSAAGAGIISTTGSIVSGTTAATAAPGELAISCVADWGGTTDTFTVTGGGFTQDAAASIGGNVNQNVGAASLVPASGATVTCTWTAGSTATTAIAVVAVIKAASAVTIVSPATLTGTTAFPAPTVRQDQTVTPATVTASTSFPAPTVRQDQTVTPAVLAVSTTFPAATVRQDRTVTPATLAVTTTIGAPVVEQDQTVAAAAVTVTTGFPAPTVHGNTATPATVTATSTFPAASAGGFTATNTAAGGTTGTAVTTANTGGTSGTAFTAVNIGAGATFAFDSTQAVHTPAMAYKVATVAAANSFVTWTAPAAMPPQAWFRAYLYITANPASAFRLVTFLNGATRCAYVQLGTSGQLQFIDHASVTMCQTTAAVPLSQWFRAEGYLTGSATTGQAELQLFTVADGLLPSEIDTSAGGQNTVGAPNGFSLGPFTAASVGPYWMDDLGVSTAGYMGPTVPVANPLTVAAAAAFPVPTVTVTTPNATATPTTLTVTTTVPVPVVEQDQTVTPATLAATTGFPAASTGVPATATPTTVTATTAFTVAWIEVGRVGVYLSGGIGTGGTGVPFATANTLWQSWTGINNPVARYYLPLSNFSYQTPMQQMVAAGTKICLTIRPAYNPVSSTDLASLTTLLQTLKAAGAIVDVALWHEPFYQGLTSAQYIAMVQYYGPTVRAYYPLVFVPNAASLAAHGEGAYYPGDAWIDKVCEDIYAAQYPGQNMSAAAAIADGASPPKPFGIWEFDGSTDPYNGQTQTNVGTFFTYIQTFMNARLAAGKVNADILLFPSLQSNWLGNVTLPNAGMTGGIGNWAPYTSGNCTTAATTAQVHSPGTGAMAMTSVAAGAMTAYCNLTPTLGQPVTAGTSIIGLQAWTRAATTARTCQVNVIWYTATGTLLSVSSGTASTNSTSGWTQFTLSGVTAPATAAFALPQVQVNGTGAAGEVHYATDVNLYLSAASSPAQCNVIVFGWDYRIGLWETLYGALNAAPPTGSGASVFPAALAVTTAFPAPVVRQDQTVAPAAVAVTTSFPAPTASGSANVTASTLTTTTTVPVPTVVWVLAGTATGGSVTAGALAQNLALTGTAQDGSGSAGTLAWQATLSGTTTAASTTAGTLAWQATLTGTGTTGTAAAGTLTWQATLTGTAATGTATTGGLTGTAAATGTAVSTPAAAGTFTSTMILAGATTTLAVAAGALTWTVTLTAAATTPTAAAGAFTAVTILAGTAASTGSTAGAVTDVAPLAIFGTAPTASITAGTFTQVMTAGATTSSPSATTGTLTRTATLTGTATTAATTAGAVTDTTVLTGTAATATLTTGTATAVMSVTGTATSATAGAGGFTQAMTVTGTSVPLTTTTGSLTWTAALTATTTTATSTAGALTGATTWTAVPAAVTTTTTGSLTWTAALTATTVNLPATAGGFTQAMTVTGIPANGTSTATGSLTWTGIIGGAAAGTSAAAGMLATWLTVTGTAATITGSTGTALTEVSTGAVTVTVTVTTGGFTVTGTTSGTAVTITATTGILAGGGGSSILGGATILVTVTTGSFTVTFLVVTAGRIVTKVTAGKVSV